MDKYILDSQIKEFKIKLLMSDGQAFEDLFYSIMSTFNTDFRKVKAFGRQGDDKNDGFIPSKGEYYQCYGPENITKSSTEKYSIKKLKEDFNGLLLKWNNEWKINSFYYVINDKYKGTPHSIFTELAKLKDVYSEIKFDNLDSKGLEEIFINELDRNQRQNIVGITTMEVILEMNNKINKIQSAINDDNLGWSNVINKIIQERIDKLEKLRLKNWYYSDNSYFVKKQYISELLNLLSRQDVIEKDFLDFLKGKYTSMHSLWREYFKNEKDIINRLISNIDLNEIDIFTNMGLDYQTYIDDCIGNIIKMFNEVVEINNKTFISTSLNTIEKKFDKVNKVINYDSGKKNQKLNELLKGIIELNNCRYLTILKEKNDVIEINPDIKKYFESGPFLILNGDVINGDEIIKYLTSIFESITEDGRELFYPDIKTNHIVFLGNFLDSNNKLEIEKLQKRSNIAVYYFRENIN
ncbi:hypothetical protein [Clostridium senegalense]|uniref:Uncharacterized protein n=1 Tax=Clostridium senegalense TaxID=1465809 RepID=A0A6M0H9Q4_9CLOT|nr:hypothetical protein [Clostridium senegalense]NEU06621.1 hypothetical protein [Clostridium senegalense]